MSVLEVVTRTAPLGLRPRDAVTGRAVTGGLTLTELRHGIEATPNRSGVFAFHDLPGLRESADGRGDDAFWNSLPTATRFEFELVDRERRYLPFRFGAGAPERILRPLPAGAQPPAAVIDVATVPLFSAPSRPLPPGMAAVRADLWDADRDAPAAGAVLDVQPLGGAPSRGVTDAQGRVLVVLAVPEPRQAGGTAAPASRRLTHQTWPLTLSVRYDGHAAGSRVAPDLDAVLAQAAGTLLDALPATPLTTATLAFGRELTLRSAGRSVLLVSPGPGVPHA